VSDNPSITQFAPHISRTAASGEPRVWAVDTRHLPLYWFPRECPRGTFWAAPETTAADIALLAGATRVHLIEEGWIDAMRSARVYAYRLPDETFAPDPEVGGYWLSRDVVLPIDVIELGNLEELHSISKIELRVVGNLWPTWNRVVGSSLEYSGIRLHNALPAPS
jgi:hypothetical protein